MPAPADGVAGVPVDAIVEDSPGARAGVRAGDRIVRVGGRPIETVYDYVRALREQTPDSVWSMVVERDGQRVTLRVGPVEVEAAPVESEP